MPSVVNSFSCHPDKLYVIEDFDKIMAKEGKKRSQGIMELIEQYNKVHANGNPAYNLDQFQDPQMKALPAFMVSNAEWVQYLKKLYDAKREDELVEIMNKASAINELAMKIHQHGTHLVY